MSPLSSVRRSTMSGDVQRNDQEGRHFHGYYDCYCYLPLYIFCGRHLLAAKLRSSNADAADGGVEEVARIVCQIRERWPTTSCCRLPDVHNRHPRNLHGSAPVLRAGLVRRSGVRGGQRRSRARPRSTARLPGTRRRACWARTKRFRVLAPSSTRWSATSRRPASVCSRRSGCVALISSRTVFACTSAVSIPTASASPAIGTATGTPTRRFGVSEVVFLEPLRAYLT
jgi:hypothetical protein